MPINQLFQQTQKQYFKDLNHNQLKMFDQYQNASDVHCILSSDCGRLSDTVRDFKRHTAKMMLESIQSEPESRKEWVLYQFKQDALNHVRNKEFQVWTHESHAVEISPYVAGMWKSKIDYIHNNPVENGLVENADEYVCIAVQGIM
jgi:hypothetical protein